MRISRDEMSRSMGARRLSTKISKLAQAIATATASGDPIESLNSSFCAKPAFGSKFIMWQVGSRRRLMKFSSFVRLAMALAASTFLAGPDRVCAEVTFLGPLPYLSSTDSPLLADGSLVTTIEDFEDGLFNTPGILNPPLGPTAPPTGDGVGIVVPPGPETDSVDGDDGVIDGFGIAGHSLRSDRFQPLITFPAWYSSSIEFEFLPDANGKYPVAFGFVWTDGQAGSWLDLAIREVNASGNVFFDTPLILGDGSTAGTTSDDRLFMVRSDLGITRVTVSSLYSGNADGSGRGLEYFEMDHLQIAFPIPEPAAALLCVAVVVPVWARKRICD